MLFSTEEMMALCNKQEKERERYITTVTNTDDPALPSWIAKNTCGNNDLTCAFRGVWT